MLKDNPGSNVQVWRRYSDFEWLTRAMQAEEPTCFIMPLPDKKIGLQNLKQEDDPELQARRNGLQKFLDHTIKHNILCANISLDVFLTGMDQDFEKKRADLPSNENPGLEIELSAVLLDGNPFLAQLSNINDAGYSGSARKVAAMAAGGLSTVGGLVSSGFMKGAGMFGLSSSEEPNAQQQMMNSQSGSFNSLLLSNTTTDTNERVLADEMKQFAGDQAYIEKVLRVL